MGVNNAQRHDMAQLQPAHCKERTPTTSPPPASTHTHHPTSTSSPPSPPRVILSSCEVNILSVNLALLGHAEHKRGNDSWEACDILCTDVMLHRSPTPIRLQYPFPQRLLRPHHAHTTAAHAHQHIIPHIRPSSPLYMSRSPACPHINPHMSILL
jgi:hypothetical protein